MARICTQYFLNLLNGLLKLVLSRLLGLFLSASLFTACAYHWGNSDRTLPGGYRQVHIPVFKNYTSEPGIEVDFTDAIRQEFERSRVARLSEPSRSEVVLIGEILTLTYVPQAPIQGGTLPIGTVLATAYDIRLSARVTLRRKSDGSVLWTSDFVNSRSYLAPQVTMAAINTVNPLYNLSARRQNIQILSLAMMAEAHDRMTENF